MQELKKYETLMQKINEYLKELEYDSEVIESEDYLGIPSVIFGIEKDDKNRDRYCHVMCVPLTEGLEYYRMYQFLVILPFGDPKKIGDHADEQINLLLSKLNNLTPLGHFGVNDAAQLTYRYVYLATDVEHMTQDKLEDLLEMMMLSLNIHQDLIESVYKKEITATQALKEAVK